MGDYKPDRPVFCGNFEYDALERDIERLFDKYGPVEKIDMKTGFAFVYMRDKRDGDDAIRRLDGEPFGYKRRRLRVEWASKPEEPKRENVKPKTTLFVVNFDSRRVQERDLDHFFSRWGRLVRVQIKKNYAFIQYSSLTKAQDALRSANNYEFMGRRLSVEYVANDDPWAGERGGGRSPDRGRSRSPRRRSRSRSPYYGGRGRSPSPAARGRSLSPRRRSVSPAYRRASPAARDSPPPRRSRSRSMSRSRSPRRRSYSR